MLASCWVATVAVERITLLLICLLRETMSCQLSAAEHSKILPLLDAEWACALGCFSSTCVPQPDGFWISAYCSVIGAFTSAVQYTGNISVPGLLPSSFFHPVSYHAYRSVTDKLQVATLNMD